MILEANVEMERCYGLALLLTVVAACGGGERRGAEQPDSAEGQGMSEMGSMGSMESHGMMREMRAHMRGMMGAGTDSLHRLMAMHRQMTANMLQQMDTEMRGMQITPDTSWTALADSVRQDLTQLPNVSAAELSEFMERHRGRVERLMARHERMMGNAR
jgi:hypothetical protein